MDSNNAYIKGIDRLINLMNMNYSSFKVGSARLWVNTAWQSPPSKRNDFEIFYIISGSVPVETGSTQITVQEGDMLFIDNFMGNSCNGGNFKMFYIQFAFIDKNNASYLREQVHEIFESLSIKMRPGKKLTLEEICANISFEFSVRRDYFGTRAKSLFMDFLIQLYRIISQKSSSRYTPSIEKYKKEIFYVVNYLSQNLDKNHSLSELSNMASLNERYFNLLFKNATGYPVFQYIQRLRVDKAKRLLEASSLPITEIAFELGFDSSQYFCKIFKKIAGITPSKYRVLVCVNKACYPEKAEEISRILDEDKEVETMVSNLEVNLKKSIETKERKAKNEGKLEGKLEIAQKMLDKGMPDEEISEITGLSLNEVKSMKVS